MNTYSIQSLFEAATPTRLRQVLEGVIDPTEPYNECGTTALHLHADHPEMTRMLLEACCDPNARTALTGQLPLHVACDQSVALLIEAGADIDAYDAQGRTALHHACMREGYAEVFELLRRGAFIDVQDYQGRTPLHYSGSPEIALTLLHAGTDPTVEDWDGQTAAQFHDDYDADLAQALQPVIGIGKLIAGFARARNSSLAMATATAGAVVAEAQQARRF